MAVSARGSDVLTQFLVESVAMGVLGGVIGIAAGFAAMRSRATRQVIWSTVRATVCDAHGEHETPDSAYAPMVSLS